MMNKNRIFGWSEFIKENKQLSQKLYLETGKISKEDFDKILEITGGDNWTKLVCQFYMEFGWEGQIYYPRIQNRPSVPVYVTPKDFYELLKRYKDNVFPIKGFHYLKLGNLKYTTPDYLSECLFYREQILKLFNQLPKEAYRNMKSDIQKEIPSENYDDFKDYYSMLGEFIEGYKANILTKSKDFQKVFNNKLFKSGSDLISVKSFLKNKENLLKGVDFTKDKIHNLSKRNDIEIVFEKGDIMVVEVTSHEGIIEIGCNSLWCFSYRNSEGERWWKKYSEGQTEKSDKMVYVIVDFSKPSDNEEFMFVIPNKGLLLGGEEETKIMVFNMRDKMVGFEGGYAVNNLFEYLFGENWESIVERILTFQKIR